MGEDSRIGELWTIQDSAMICFMLEFHREAVRELLRTPADAAFDPLCFGPTNVDIARGEATIVIAPSHCLSELESDHGSPLRVEDSCKPLKEPIVLLHTPYLPKGGAWRQALAPYTPALSRETSRTPSQAFTLDRGGGKMTQPPRGCQIRPLEFHGGSILEHGELRMAGQLEILLIGAD